MDLREEIGGGSYGKVHIAKWRETTVAVKVLGNGIIPEDKNGHGPVEHNTLLNLEKVQPLSHFFPRLEMISAML